MIYFYKMGLILYFIEYFQVLTKRLFSAWKIKTKLKMLLFTTFKQINLYLTGRERDKV